MTLFPVMVGILAVLMIGTVLVVLGVAIIAAIVGSRRGAGQGQHVPGPGELDVMTESMRSGVAGNPHGVPGVMEGDRLMAMGIAVDSLAASQATDYGHSHGHGHSPGHSGGLPDAGMPHGHDMSPPMHHDPGPTTMPTTMPDVPSHHHG